MNWFKEIFGQHRNELQEQLAEWRVFSAENVALGEFAVIRLRVVRPQIAGNDFATAVEISWKYVGDVPPPEVNQKQLEFETAIDVLTGDNGFSELVQVSTGRGGKEWLFYTSDQQRFMAEFNRLLGSREPYPLDISFYPDPDWNLWRETVEALNQKIN